MNKEKKSIIFRRSRKLAACASAVILAAGSSSRMGGEQPKQLMKIGGIPAVIRSCLAFERSEAIRDITLVVPAGEEAAYRELCAGYGITKLRPGGTVAGGDSRQRSVLRGLNSLDNEEACADYIAIHDAARCLITPAQITDVAAAAIKYGAAIAASAVSDTVKIAGRGGFIEGTPDRRTLRVAQTPQIFAANIYRAAAFTALEAGFEATDDASLAERAGFPVMLVDCGRANIKLTTPEDVAIAEALLGITEPRG